MHAPGWKQDEYRMRLAQLRISGSKALQPLSTLSPSEQLKTALACLFCGPHAPALMLLDEPDNYLDFQSRELLQQAMPDYRGAVVLVSHDPQFVAAIAKTNTLLLS